MTIDREAEALLQKLNVAVKAANEAETEFTSRAKTVGLLLLEAKKLYPAVKDFKAFLNQVDGLHLSRAYDYMRLAGGRTTDTELKKDARDRQRKSRGKKKLPKPSPSVTSRKSDEISIEQRRADHAALDMTAEEKAEASK
jgi:hypothetical protein